jgi:hypothetical protein
MTAGATVLAAMLMLSASPASATPLTPITGSFTRSPTIALQVVRLQTLGTATYIDVIEHGTMTGTFTGTYSADDKCLEFSDGTAVCQSELTVAVHGGTVTEEIGGTFNTDLNNPPAATLEARFLIVGGTGELAGIRGAGSMEATLAVDGTYSGTYSGEMTIRR